MLSGFEEYLQGKTIQQTIIFFKKTVPRDIEECIMRR